MLAALAPYLCWLIRISKLFPSLTSMKPITTVTWHTPHTTSCIYKVLFHQVAFTGIVVCESYLDVKFFESWNYTSKKTQWKNKRFKFFFACAV